MAPLVVHVPGPAAAHVVPHEGPPGSTVVVAVAVAVRDPPVDRLSAGFAGLVQDAPDDTVEDGEDRHGDDEEYEGGGQEQGQPG